MASAGSLLKILDVWLDLSFVLFDKKPGRIAWFFYLKFNLVFRVFYTQLL
ncbi:hypothetical protein B0O44_107193 [Pedobacter nutrimenti]|uniref:Uncharacterized protein n=1 Tax=Pedobacter nutrimenti TaxID=1241337 RepID=A0A318U9I9_9SPHI|nr:hypothetical protein B0O44_107193 [Pedobacter nutrimenti]